MTDFFDDLARTSLAADFTAEQITQVQQFLNEQSTSRGVDDRFRFIDVLLQTPGLDPVLTAVDGNPDDIPSNGWLMKTHIAPGYGGVVDIYRYLEGSLELGSISDSRKSEPSYDNVRLYFKLLNDYGWHNVAYENPGYPYKSTKPYDRMGQASYTGLSWDTTDVVDLSNGGRLLNKAGEMKIAKGGGLFTSIDWRDYSQGSSRENSPTIDINRAVASHEEVGAALVNLGFGMGLEDEDVKTLITTVGEKISRA
jgi:hypothetical protein